MRDALVPSERCTPSPSLALKPTWRLGEHAVATHTLRPPCVCIVNFHRTPTAGGGLADAMGRHKALLLAALPCPTPPYPPQAPGSSHARMSYWHVCTRIHTHAGGGLADAMGRRKAFLLAALPMLLGPLMCAGAGSFNPMAIGRFLTGLALGLSSAIVPTYISEVCVCVCVCVCV